MNQYQKVIKYVAMAFAVFLTVFIIGSIVSFSGIMFRIFNFGSDIIDNRNNNGDVMSEDAITRTFDDVDKISINHGAGSLTIKSSDSDKITVDVAGEDSDSYKVRTSGRTLNIEQKGHVFNIFNFGWNRNMGTKIIVSIPKGMKLEDLDVDAGAGKITIEDIIVNDFSLDAGAGSVTISRVEAYEADINGGAGEVIFSDVVFYDSDISCGVGRVKFEGKLLNKNDISAGVGELDLIIHGKRDDYNMKIEKGLGEIRIDGQKYSEVNIRQNDAKHSLDIEGGLGSINVEFVD
ncbi:MAG: DUF4097 domain-containing protein [Clostridiales bacterium]|nr:DUF4097 domain-containing protein [Clostridiales bacterium]